MDTHSLFNMNPMEWGTNPPDLTKIDFSRIFVSSSSPPSFLGVPPAQSGPGPGYPSQTTLHSNISAHLGTREEPFAIGFPPSSPSTAEILFQEIVDGATSQQFESFLFSIGVDPSVLTTTPITLGIFTSNFPIWGTLVLKGVFAVVISMVYYDEDYQWISTQRPGEVHPLTRYVYLSIQVVLCAHIEDYPHAPPESDGFHHLPFIIQCAIDELVTFRNCIKLFGRLWAFAYGFHALPSHTDMNSKLFDTLTKDSRYLHYTLEDDRMWFTSPPIIMTMHHGFYGMPQSPPRRMHEAHAIYPSLAKQLRALDNHSFRDMSWRQAPPASWTMSAGSVRHGVGEFSTGDFMPRDVGNADAIRHRLLKNLIRTTPAADLVFFHDLCNKTAPMWYNDLDFTTFNPAVVLEAPAIEDTDPDDVKL